MDSPTRIVATPDIAKALRERPSALSDKLNLLSDALADPVVRCAEELRSIAATPLSLSVTELAPGRLDDIPEALGKQGLLAAYGAADSPEKLLIGLSSGLIRIWVDALFGGDGSEHVPSDERPCSSGERQAAQILLEKLNEALTSTLEAMGVPGFAFERTDAAADSPERSGAAIRAALTIQLLGHHGTAIIGIPIAALTPLKPELSAGKLGASPISSDPQWSKRLETEVKRAEVEVQAVIEEARILAEVASLQVGQILPLRAKPTTHVKLACNGQALFWCELGQGDGNYTVRIHDPVNPPEEAHL